MRYRMEVIKDELVIRNVETDLVLGNVQRHCVADPHDPDRLIVTAVPSLIKMEIGSPRLATSRCQIP